MLGLPRQNLVALGMVGVSVGAFVVWNYTSGTDLPVLEPLPAAALQGYDNWSAPLRTAWTSAVMTALSNQSGLREGFSNVVHAAPTPEGIELTPSKRDGLVDCLTTFFHAWSSDAADVYLR